MSFTDSVRNLSRAATMTVTMASLALPWMTPPPCEVLLKQSGRLKAVANQSRTMVSSSVAAGLHIQLNMGPLNVAEYISPKMPGKDELHGKKAMKFGDCLA